MFLKRIFAGAVLAGYLAFTQTAGAEEFPIGTVMFDEVIAPVEAGGFLDIEGRLRKGQTASALDINGYPATLEPDGRFVLSVPATDQYQVNLYRPDGTYQSVDYAAPGTDVSRAVQAVVGAGFLEELKDPLSNLLNNQDLAALLGLNDGRCAVDTIFLVGCDLYIDQFLLRAEPVVHELFASPSDGDRLTVNLKASIPSADLTGRLQRPLLFFWTYRKTTFNLQNVDLDLKVDVVPGPDGSLRLETDQADLNLKIGGVRVVETNNLVSYLVPVFKDAIQLLLNQRFVLALAGPYVEDILVAAAPGTVPLDLDGDQVDDVAFTIDVAFEELDVLGGGDPYALLTGSISPAAPAPGRDVLGYRRHGGTLPEPGPVVAPADVRAELSIDLLNQALIAVYQSGVDETFELRAKVEEFGRFSSQFLGLGIDPGSDIVGKLHFGGALESVALPGGEYPLGLQIFLPHTTLDLKGQRNGSEVLLVSLTGDFLLESSLGVQPDGSLQLEFGDKIIEGDITDVYPGGLLYEAVGGGGIPTDTLYAILDALLPFLINEVEPAISGILNAIPLGLDAGQVLGSLLSQQFPSLEVTATPIETGMSEDGTYLEVGVGIDIQE